jgi:membrane-bound transcription factor site-1 protease
VSQPPHARDMADKTTIYTVHMGSYAVPSLRGLLDQVVAAVLLCLFFESVDFRERLEFLDVARFSPPTTSWIVRFTEYIPYDSAREVVRVLSSGCSGTVRFVERDNPATRANLPTDFAVVTSRWLSAEEALPCIQKIAVVKDVHPDSKIQAKQLLGLSNDGVEALGDSGDEGEHLVSNRSGRFQTRWSYEDNENYVGRNADGVAPGRALLKGSGTELVDRLNPRMLWEMGYSGEGIRMGVFDTGIKKDHPDIDHVDERSNWTHEDTLADGLGHGSFVAGVIAGHHPDCPGLAPNVSIHTFKVFTNDQISFTSWFLDAFNYAMATDIDIVNLSIGGPDYLDAPFVEKVMEATSRGMVMTSAIGNDGPTYGTMNNPADQNDVIGVGGITYADQMAGFSSRGMTTWEIPLGYGRVKPDVVTYGNSVRGSAIGGGCRSLSGTSVSSPVAAGALCLLASTIPAEKRKDVLNPAAMKQILIEGADRIPVSNMFEQGQGGLSIANSFEVLRRYEPRASIVPATLNMTDCPYAWPFCTQPIYANAMPTIFNATVLNGMGVEGTITRAEWRADNEGARLADVQIEYSESLWPWSGYLALFVRVGPEGSNFSGIAEGTVTVDVESPPGLGETEPRRSTASMQVLFEIIPTPERSKRVLWDQFHSIKYPPAYLPRDDLMNNMDILDWLGDHPHTNFHTLFDTLRHEGYFLEILGSPLTCFDALQYGTLLLVDSEEEFYPEEISKLEEDVKEKGLGLAVFADWYDLDMIPKMRFYDDNTRSWWDAVTGGAHVPALNDLLRPFDAAFAGGSYKLKVHAPDGTNFDMTSGSAIAAMPSGSYLHYAEDQIDKARGKVAPRDIPVLGLARVGQGRIALYGDSNCLDSASRRSSCESFTVSLLQYLSNGDESMLSGMSLKEDAFGSLDNLPQRVSNVDYATVSRVLSSPLSCYSNSNAGLTFDNTHEVLPSNDRAHLTSPVVETDLRAPVVDGDDQNPLKDGLGSEDGVDQNTTHPALHPDDYHAGEVDTEEEYQEEEQKEGQKEEQQQDEEDYRSEPLPPPPGQEAILENNVFQNGLQGTGRGGERMNVSFWISREWMLASVAFALLTVLLCSRWKRFPLRKRRGRGVLPP